MRAYSLRHCRKMTPLGFERVANGRIKRIGDREMAEQKSAAFSVAVQHRLPTLHNARDLTLYGILERGVG